MRLIEPGRSGILVCQSHLCRDWFITCQSDGWMDVWGGVAQGGTDDAGEDE